MQQRKRILIVDDDDQVRAGLARALAAVADYDVATAADAFEAGYRIADSAPDLVLLDIVLPGMGGLDICERIRRVTGQERIKIVILTGFPGGGHSERSLIAGADLFLTKPQDVATLVAHIRDLLDE